MYSALAASSLRSGRCGICVVSVSLWHFSCAYIEIYFCIFVASCMWLYFVLLAFVCSIIMHSLYVVAVHCWSIFHTHQVYVMLAWWCYFCQSHPPTDRPTVPQLLLLCWVSQFVECVISSRLSCSSTSLHVFSLLNRSGRALLWLLETDLFFTDRDFTVQACSRDRDCTVQACSKMLPVLLKYKALCHCKWSFIEIIHHQLELQTGVVKCHW